MYLEKLKDMFNQMVLKKNASLIPFYYHEGFLLYTNDIQTNYTEFLESHQKYYATAIQYQVEYDEETLLEQDERVAARVWITTTKPGESAKRIEVILIAQYKQDKIYRLWELTYPDWSKLAEFKQ
jgi:hypothetical protein